MPIRSVRRRLKERVPRVLWATVVPTLRFLARRRLRGLEPDAVTVVTVNWNSSPYLAVLLELVRRRSPFNVEILVVDNGSRDGTRALLANHTDVRAVFLPLNVGHDLAMDIGFLTVRTEYVVALDVDAFPLHERWLDELITPLISGAEIAGARLNRQYVHPCCLAMRTARFVLERHSFRSRYRPRGDGHDASGDVGEDMSMREAGRLKFFDPTSQRGPGDVGTVFGNIVYHNFYSTRFDATRDAVLDAVVGRDDPRAAWEEALAKYYDGER